MKKVKITILITMLNEDLAKEYGIPGLKACPMMKVGDVFYADYAKPEGFCDEAWKAIYQYVFALAHGAEKELFYYGDWIKEPGVAIVSCNDGLRPVHQACNLIAFFTPFFATSSPHPACHTAYACPREALSA
jgi:uncharacterized repeat protein (TIGR04076 family)